MAINVKRSVILFCLFAVIGFALFYKLGAVPLADPDEPRYAEAAREMIERGSYMVPYFNYELRLQKPVLHYLLICASYKILDVSEFSARLPSVLAALALLGITFFFMQRFCGMTAAALSCLIMGSSPLYFVPARMTMPDMVFSCFIIASLLCFYLGWQALESGAKKWWYAGFYFFQVIAAWTKGPVGILVPVAVALLSLWHQRDLRELKRMRLGPCLILVLLASLPWYLYIYFFVDKETMTELSRRETAGRVFGLFGRNYDPLYYYFIVLFAGLLPWVFLLPWALYQRFQKLEPSRLRSFLETWFLFVFLFFTVCATKKAQYVVMLSCVCAAWLGTVISDALHEFPGKRDTGLVASFFACLAVSIVGAFKGLSWLSKNHPDLIVGGIAAMFTLIVPALAALWLAARGHARSACVALCFVTFLTLIPGLGYGTAWIEKNRSVKAFLRENEAVIAQARELYTGVKIFNSLSFYLRRQVILDTDEEKLVLKLQGTEPCIVFTTDKRYKYHKELFAPYLTAANYNKVLLSNFAARGVAP